MRQITVIDGLGLAHRAFNNRLSYGPAHRFFSLLGNVYRTTHPTHMVIALDDKDGKLHRQELWPKYKANRKSAPEGQKEFFDKLFEACSDMGLATVRVPGWEADDVMASIARNAMPSDNVYLATADKDLLAAIGPACKVYDYSCDHFYDEDYVRSRYEVEAWQMSDFLALVGDSIDGIPGLPRVGPKTAKNLLSAHDSISGIVESNAVAPELHDDLLLWQQLTSLNFKLDVPDIEEFKFTPLDPNKAWDLLGDLRARAAIRGCKLPTLGIK